MSLVVLTIIVPGVANVLARRLLLSPRVIEKRLAQTSCLLLAYGSLAIFLAQSPWIVILGCAFTALGSSCNTLARSFVTSLIRPDCLGAAYTGITVATYGGSLASGPILARIFHWGLKIGGPWTGLPFLVASGLFVFCLIMLSLMDMQSVLITRS